MGTKVYLILSALLCLVCFYSGSALADSIRCGNKLVKTGDTTVEVKLKCGEPFEIENTGKVKMQNMYVDIVRYTYVPATGKLIQILEFHNGDLVKITNGPRV
tara:strand:+ start:485 stop:790 length:306 start_codon:yes stop_codon:yes gene_type:complete